MAAKATKQTGPNTYEIQGLSTDAKPLIYASGSTYYELDTGKGWVYDSNNINPLTSNGWWGA